MPRCARRNCRQNLPGHAQFCSRCGQRVPRIGGAFVIALLIGFVGLAAVMLLAAVRVQTVASPQVQAEHNMVAVPQPVDFGSHDPPVPSRTGN